MLSPQNEFPGRRRDAVIAATLWFAAIFVVLFLVRLWRGPLCGHDAYFHVAAARFLAENGLAEHRLPWTRLSVFAEHWGDKEFLFHVLLIPFVAVGGLLRGGHAALSLLNGLQAALVAYVAVRWSGRRGALAPLLVMALSTTLWHRLDFLRPHNLALILFIAGAYAIGRRRYVTVGVLAALFALSYTAWQAFWLMCAGSFGLLWLFRRERSWRLILYPLAGIAAGLLLHPAFPDNLRVWYLQNVAYFQYKNVLSVGAEIRPLSTGTMLLHGTMGLFLAAAACLTTRPWSGARPQGRQELVLAGFALTFACLALLSYRFAEYAVPFLALYGWVAFCRLADNPCHTDRNRRLRRGLMAVLIPYAVLFNLVLHIQAGFTGISRFAFRDMDEVIAIGEALPDQARVAARWDSTSLYIFAAPQASYLNVLDPVFMKAFDPDLNQVCDDLFTGRLPDVVDALRNRLQSDYVALPHARHRTLYRRLEADPRMQEIMKGPRHAVFEVVSAEGFVTDWEIGTEGGEGAIPPAGTTSLSPWPGASDPNKAFVTRDRLPEEQRASEEGWWAVRSFPSERTRTVWVGFTAAGPSEIYLEGNLLLKTQGDPLAIMDTLAFPLLLEAGQPNRVAIYTRPGRYSHGFFWKQAGS